MHPGHGEEVLGESAVRVEHNPFKRNLSFTESRPQNAWV